MIRYRKKYVSLEMPAFRLESEDIHSITSGVFTLCKHEDGTGKLQQEHGLSICSTLLGKGMNGSQSPTREHLAGEKM